MWESAISRCKDLFGDIAGHDRLGFRMQSTSLGDQRLPIRYSIVGYYPASGSCAWIYVYVSMPQSDYDTHTHTLSSQTHFMKLSLSHPKRLALQRYRGKSARHGVPALKRGEGKRSALMSGEGEIIYKEEFLQGHCERVRECMHECRLQQSSC